MCSFKFKYSREVAHAADLIRNPAHFASFGDAGPAATLHMHLKFNHFRKAALAAFLTRGWRF